MMEDGGEQGGPRRYIPPDEDMLFVRSAFSVLLVVLCLQVFFALLCLTPDACVNAGVRVHTVTTTKPTHASSHCFVLF